MEPLVTLLALVLGVSTIVLGRYVSLGSLLGLLAAPLLVLAKGSFMLPYFLLSLALMVLAFLRHIENIKRLKAGTERRLGEKAISKEQA